MIAKLSGDVPLDLDGSEAFLIGFSQGAPSPVRPNWCSGKAEGRSPGAILSVPMLAITKIICDRVRPLAAFEHFPEG